jgi:hypothetical protein
VHRRLLAPLAAGLVLAAAPAAHACGSSGYTYAGISSRDKVSGAGATLTALAAPAVQNGHVAGWVGVGGPGRGPHGSSEWIQVGYSGFPGLSLGSLYYEVALPGASPKYFEVSSSIHAGSKHRVAVLEMGKRHGWWRVWVDGRVVSRAYRLPGSHRAWPAIATAESWGGGTRSCNLYAYRFDRVAVARQAGGTWNRLNAVYRIQGGDNRLLLSSSSSFVARTTSLPRPEQPRTAAAAQKPAAPPAPAPAAAAPPAPAVADVAAATPAAPPAETPTADPAPATPPDPAATSTVDAAPPRAAPDDGTADEPVAGP